MNNRDLKFVKDANATIKHIMTRMSMGDPLVYKNACKAYKKKLCGTISNYHVAIFKAFYKGYTGPDITLGTVVGFDSDYVTIMILGAKVSQRKDWVDRYSENLDDVFKNAIIAINRSEG